MPCISSHIFYLSFFLSTCHYLILFFFFSSRRRHTRSDRDWSSDVCSSDLPHPFELTRSRGLPLRRRSSTAFVPRPYCFAREYSAGRYSGRVAAQIPLPDRDRKSVV